MPRVPWLGALALAAAALLYDLLLGTVRRFDRGYPSTNPSESTWWFGYARDLANLAGATGFAVAFAVMGYRPPIALLAAFLLTMAAYGLDYVLARGISARRAELYLAAILVVAIVAIYRLRHEIEAALEGLVAALF